jgi:hypothetical protein
VRRLARADRQAEGVDDGESVVARQEYVQNQQADEDLGLQEEAEQGASAREAQPNGRNENADRREGHQDAAPRSSERQLTESRRDEGQERSDRPGLDEGHEA